MPNKKVKRVSINAGDRIVLRNDLIPGVTYGTIVWRKEMNFRRPRKVKKLYPEYDGAFGVDFTNFLYSPEMVYEVITQKRYDDMMSIIGDM